MGIYVGLDIGGTKFMVASFDENLKEIRMVKNPTPESLENGIGLLDIMISEVSQGERILGIGAAAGGPMDVERGIISPLHQPMWRDVPIKDIMEKTWSCPFFVDVDTNVGALGEYHLGNYKEKSFLYITLSTGMGGGYLVDGKVYAGKCHPEIAHQSINYHCSYPDNITCECGAPDCLEGIVSGNGIRRIYGKPAEKLNSEEWEEVSYNLAQGIRNITAILSPDIIVFGGGVAVGGGEELLSSLNGHLKKLLYLVDLPVLKLSVHGYDTALIGAGYLAKESTIIGK